MTEMSSQNRPILNLHGQVQFDLPPTNFTHVIQTMDLPLVGSPLTLYYPEEESIPAWTTITWLLEDYGFSQTKKIPTDIHNKRTSRQWYVGPPCSCGKSSTFLSMPPHKQVESSSHPIQCQIQLAIDKRAKIYSCQVQGHLQIIFSIAYPPL